MQSESVVFPFMEVSFLESSNSSFKSSSNSESVFGFDWIEFGLNSGFVVEVRNSNFFGLINEFIEFASFCSF